MAYKTSYLPLKSAVGTIADCADKKGVPLGYTLAKIELIHALKDGTLNALADVANAPQSWTPPSAHDDPDDGNDYTALPDDCYLPSAEYMRQTVPPSAWGSSRLYWEDSLLIEFLGNGMRLYRRVRIRKKDLTKHWKKAPQKNKTVSCLGLLEYARQIKHSGVPTPSHDAFEKSAKGHFINHNVPRPLVRKAHKAIFGEQKPGPRKKTG